MRARPCLLAALTLAAAPLGAIELSLEENRAERGNIGYIDIQKVFAAYPETIRAKENFEEVVQQTEEQVNLRKAEILRLRNELSELKIQRDFLAKTPNLAPPAGTSPKPSSPETAASTKTLSEPPVSPSTASAVSGLPGFAAPSSTGAAITASTEPAKPPLASLFPEISTAPIAISPRPAPILLPQATGQAASPVQVSTAAAPAPAPSSALAELDAKIEGETKELADKEADFKEYQATAEKNLLDLESRKTEILLGKIHRGIQEVARAEGISVVIDKSSILFGHSAVDLTDKVLKRLSGAEEKIRIP